MYNIVIVLVSLNGFELRDFMISSAHWSRVYTAWTWLRICFSMLPKSRSKGSIVCPIIGKMWNMLSNLSATRLWHMCRMFQFYSAQNSCLKLPKDLLVNQGRKNFNRHDHISSDPREATSSDHIHIHPKSFPQSCIPQLYVQSFIL